MEHLLRGWRLQGMRARMRQRCRAVWGCLICALRGAAWHEGRACEVSGKPQPIGCCAGRLRCVQRLLKAEDILRLAHTQPLQLLQGHLCEKNRSAKCTRD